MFTYFHCYLPETWDAQVKAGLINKNSGIKFSESIAIDDDLKFNNLAARNMPLYNILKESKLPFYIDRLQGGCYFENYPYDMSLIQEYRDMLGDKFYGFQMHEWMSNYRSDIAKLINNHCPQWTKESITATILKAYPFPHLFLESASAEEIEKFGLPGTYLEFLKNSVELFNRRQSYTGGDLLPCDSYYLSYPVELRAGIKRLMPEIGAQTRDTRIQVAYARGMAKAYNIPFGTYYEPWGGQPFSACLYQVDGKNEWNIHSGADFPYQTNGSNGGSSRSMQRRMHLYSYMAGASFMGEEWGMCNTFYDWNDFELSPYGEIKKEFIDFTEKYSDIGIPYTPAAVVLPKDLFVIEGIQKDDDTYLEYPISGSFADMIRYIRQNIRSVFCSSGPMTGTETTSLLNCSIFDAIDIVTEDVVNTNHYDILVDLTYSSEFARKYNDKICSVEDLSRRLEDFLPCIVNGNAMKQLTKTEDGNFYILLTNNSGVVRTIERGDEFLTEASETISIETKYAKSLIQLEGSGLSKDDNGIYHIDIPAGGYFFGMIK